LESFLQLNERIPRWICPICSRTAFFEELFFDEYLFRILSSVSSLVSEVEIHPDGSWTVPMVSKYSNQSIPLGMDRCCVDGNSVENSSAASEIYLNPSNSLGNENKQVDSNRPLWKTHSSTAETAKLAIVIVLQ